jgi:hypothetical protein
MTAKEALYLIDVQLAHTEQNKEVLKVLEKAVYSVYSVAENTTTLLLDDAEYDDIPYQLYGTEEQHFKNHLDNIAKRDLKKHSTDANNDKKNKKGETQ